MNKRKLLTLSAAFLLGAAAMEYHCSWLYLPGSAVGIIYGCYCRKNSVKRGSPFILVWGIFLGMMLGSFRSYGQTEQRAFYTELLQNGEKCLLQGQIFKKEEKNKEYLYYLKDCIWQYQKKQYTCNQVLVYLDTDTYSIGKILCINGKINTFALPTNEGSFHERQYYHSINIEFAVKDAKVTGVFGKENALKEYLYAIRRKIQTSFSACMDASDAGVMTAMTLGNKNYMDTEVKSMYQKAGINHFYSISGLHISMLGMALYRLLRKVKCSYGTAGILSGSFIWCYGMLAGFGVSAVRAVGMFLILLYGKFRGRSYDRPTALSVLAGIIVWKNPDVLHHSGFLLSFGAVLGVIMAQYFMEDMKKLNKGKENFMVSLCIQLITIPILCCYFYEISVYAVLINLIILPFLCVLFGCGISGGIVGCFSIFSGKIILLPCHWILGLFAAICRLFRHLPHDVWITGTFSTGKILCWYGALGCMIFCHWIKEKTEHKFVNKMQGIVLLILCLLWALCLALPPKQEAECVFLDVGQGDGICIANGDGTHLFIDGGSSSVSKVGTYQILPYLKYHGIRKIDYWFVSHCDNDHISGLQEVLEADYKIDYLIMPKYLPKDTVWKELCAQAKEKNISILYMEQGQSLYSKNRKKEKLWEAHCLFPGESNLSEDKNAMSMAILYKQSKFSALFAGDLAKEQEKQLLTEMNLSQMDVFKANHHGSQHSNSRELLEAIQPQVAVISCGEGNRYGHPHEEALDRFADVGAEICRTDKMGAVHIKIPVHNLESLTASMLKYPHENN